MMLRVSKRLEESFAIDKEHSSILILFLLRVGSKNKNFHGEYLGFDRQLNNSKSVGQFWKNYLSILCN